eukprot:GDKI01020077.1.p1 GENE.GDKI01020077.1~~GDKI01020077.1.p1  ORF type:complete len:324 (+),score=117.47 GDKI01020077.1:65-1036(+)
MADMKLENVYLDDDTDPLNFNNLGTVSLAPATSPGGSTVTGTMSSKPQALEFHEFEHDSFNKGASAFEERQGLVTAPDGDAAPATGVDGADASGGSGWFWNVSYYQPYFNVSTADVKQRMMMVLDPRPLPFTMPGISAATLAGSAPAGSPQTFWETFQYYPDMYGPVWISLTLVIAIGISGNVSGFLGYRPDGAKGEDFQGDFKKITAAASLIMALGLLFPLAIWGVLMYFGSKARYVRLVSLSGYSLAPFVPAAAICAIPIAFFQWLALLAAAALCMLFLFKNLNDEVKRVVPANLKVPIMAAVGAAYFIVLLLLKLKFFTY